MFDLITEASARSRQGDDAIERTLIGGVFVLLSPLAIPAVILLGYLVRVLLAGVRGTETLPDIYEWKGLAVEGAQAMVVLAVFGVPFLLLVVLSSVALKFIGVSVFAEIALPPALILLVVLLLVPLFGFPGAAMVVGGLAGFQLVSGVVVPTPLVLLLALVFVPVLAYPIPAVLASLGIGGSVREAFAVGRLRRILTTRQYLKGILEGWLVLITGAAVGGLLSVILVGVFVVFLSQVVAAYVFGRAFTNAADAVAS